MNTNLSSQTPYSPPSSGGESEEIVSTDSPNRMVLTPSLNVSSREVACLPQKRKAGRKKFKETRHPIFRGVRERDRGKWVCEVREPNKKSRIWVGTYPTAELAARAHDVAALALKGDEAALNFPDSAWLAPRARSASARDIRLAALQATRSDLRSSSPCEGEGNSHHNSEEIEENSSSITTSNSNGMHFENNNNIEYDPKELFLDEEAIFNMPTFIDSMAAGMLLTPPSLKRGVGYWDDMEEEDMANNNCYIDLNLW